MSSSIENLFTKDELIFEDDDDDDPNECSNSQSAINFIHCSPTAGVKRNKELEDKIRHQEILIEETEAQCTNLLSQLEFVQGNCQALKLKKHSLEKNLIVLRQERDEINFALADERHKNARLLNIEQEKHALLCEINRLQENLQTQRKEVNAYKATIDGLQKEFSTNAASYEEREISYTEELYICREAISRLEDELDYLKSKASSEHMLQQTSCEILTNEEVLDGALLSSSTVALCVQILALLATYWARKCNAQVNSDKYNSGMEIEIWQGQYTEFEAVELMIDTQSKSQEVWQAETLESELSRTNFWCPEPEEPYLTSCGIARPGKLCTMKTTSRSRGKFGMFFKFLVMIGLVFIWILLDFPMVECSLRVGEFQVGIGKSI